MFDYVRQTQALIIGTVIFYHKYTSILEIIKLISKI